MGLATAIAIITVLVLFHDSIFKPTPVFKPTPLVPLVSPTVTPPVFQPLSLEFEPIEYDVKGNRVVFEHALSITEKGRNELLSFTNYGNQTVKFTLVEVIPSNVYDNEYKELSFQDEVAGQTIGFRILVHDFTLKSGETKNLQVKSNSNSLVGLIFFLVTDPNVNIEELKSILEKQVSEGKIRLLELSPTQAKTIAKQINDIVNNASKTWQERKNELEGIAATYGVEISEYNASFVALASEIQPGALIQIPIFASENLGEIVYKIEGDLSQYASIETQNAENVTILKIFFDFRNGINSGRINIVGGNIEVPELNGTLIVSFPQFQQEQRFQLRILFDNVPINYFLITSPRNVFENNSVTIANNLPFDLQNVSGCGLNNVTLGKNSELTFKPTLEDDLKCILTQNGKIIQAVGFSTEENYLSREFKASWLSCSDFKCDCDTFSTVALLIEERVFENTKFISDLKVFEKLFGTREYSFKIPIKTESDWNCKLPSEFASVKTLAGSNIMLTITTTIGDFPPIFKITVKKR